MSEDQSFGKCKKEFGTSSEKSNVKANGKEKTAQKGITSMENSKQLRDLREEARVARRSREERENERRRRIDELKSRNDERRSRVEERKRLLCEAENEKREAIIRKNREAEARIEIKKIQEREKKKRSRIVERSKTPVAFGSSTPRPLCHNEASDSFCSSCWSIARDREVDKTRSSFVGEPNKKFNGVERAKGRSVTPSSIKGNRKATDRTRRETPNGESTCTSSIGWARKPSLRSGDTTPSSGQSRSSSFTTRYSSASLDSDCTVGSRRCAIPRRTTKAIGVVDNGGSIETGPDRANRCTRDAKLAPFKSGIPKLLKGRRISSVLAPLETKKPFQVENSRARGVEDRNSTEEKTMRLANEMLKIEKQRLKLAIEETKRWEEREQQKEEIARRRQEKMEAERQAREEAERYRNEISERLRKDSEERTERRKRVQIIMLRTRGENRFEITEESRGRSR